MYTVFLQTLLTNDTKKIVRDHEATRDAQAIYTALRKFVQDSPDATIFVNELTQFLTTDKLDRRWRGTTKGYLTHWDQKMAGSVRRCDAHVTALLRGCKEAYAYERS